MEIEPFLRNILADKTVTPHSSTERADILTTHVTYRGNARLTAFVNKGRATQSVTLNKISGQIYKARTIPQVELLVLLAVGNIQDEASANFVQSATDAGSDFMIVNATDVARLFIAYHKLCPKDGVPYIDGKCSQCGIPEDQPIEIILKVYEKPLYDITSQSDNSFGPVKRYSADVLTDSHYSKAVIREIIRNSTWQLRRSSFYGSEQARRQFGDKEADVVWLFVFYSEFDRQQRNCACHSLWISPKLPKEFRPIDLDNAEWVDDIQLNWQANYETWRDHLLQQKTTKENWIQKIRDLLPEIDYVSEYIQKAVASFEALQINQNRLEEKLKYIEEIASRIYRSANEMMLPPLECTDCNMLFHRTISQLHNSLVPFANWGKAGWDWSNRLYILKKTLKDHKDSLQQFLYEWRKVTGT